MLKSDKNAAYILAGFKIIMILSWEYIIKFSEECWCNKVSKRNNEILFSKQKFDQPYENQNSFGKTYGLHRNKLEFNINQIKELKKLCDECKVDFICTPFDEISLKELLKIKTSIFKIASFDMGNLRLISEILKNDVKLILSTGEAILK